MPVHLTSPLGHGFGLPHKRITHKVPVARQSVTAQKRPAATTWQPTKGAHDGIHETTRNSFAVPQRQLAAARLSPLPPQRGPDCDQQPLCGETPFCRLAPPVILALANCNLVRCRILPSVRVLPGDTASCLRPLQGCLAIVVEQ